MKKYTWLLLVLAFVFALTACGGNTTQNNGETEANTTAAPVGSGHTHCVCGGDAVGLGDHTCTEVEDWLAWPGIDNVVDGGHYYLTEDLTGTPLTWYAETKHFSVCLNGHNVTMEDHISIDGSLTICDCAETQGTVMSTLNDAEAAGGIISVTDGCSLDIYGGNFTTQDGCKVASGGGIYVGENATVNMYGGAISNSVAAKNGGNFYVDKSAALNIYSGKLSNKTDTLQATRGANIYAYGAVAILGDDVEITGGNSNHGGSIYIEESGAFRMTGGTIKDGTTTGNGGNIYSKVDTQISGGKILNGTAGKGGNIFLHTKGQLTISNAEVSGGTATNCAGNLYVYTGGESKATIESGAVFANGTAPDGGNIANNGELVINGGSVTGGDIYMNNDVAGTGTVTINGGVVEKLTAGAGPWYLNKVESAMSIHVLNAKDAIIYLYMANMTGDSAAVTITANDPAVALVAYVDVENLPANVQASGMKTEVQSVKYWKLVQG